jgi:DNA replication licensing factor MCM5
MRKQVLFFCFWVDCTRSSVATEEHVAEAIRLFHVSTLDAARSGITANLVVTPEMRAEIQVRELHNNYV